MVKSVTRLRNRFTGSGLSRYAVVARQLQEEIASGKYPVGSQLPAELKLAQQFNVAYLTIRQALGLLAKKGIVSRRQGHGTFVETTREQTLIGVLVGADTTLEYSHFHRALLRELDRLSGSAHCIFRSHRGLTDPEGEPLPSDSAAYTLLRSDLNNYPFAGFLEISPGVRGFQHLLEDTRLPRAIFEPYRDDTDIILDTYRFCYDSIKRLATLGRRRIAYLDTGFSSRLKMNDLDGLFDATREMHLPAPTVEGITKDKRADFSEKEVFERTLRLIQKWRMLDAEKMPDAILVSDDIAARAVAMALMQARVRVPEDLLVMTCANKGIEHHYGIPVIRYEFPIDTIARSLLEILVGRIEGRPPVHRPVIVRGQIHKE